MFYQTKDQWKLSGQRQELIFQRLPRMIGILYDVFGANLKWGIVTFASELKSYWVSYLDSHADTCSFGINSSIYDSVEVLDIMPFLPNLGKNQARICTITIACDYLKPSTIYILVFHQSLYFKALDCNLTCPNQLYLTGNEIGINILQFIDNNISHQSHSIVKKSIISLLTCSIVSYFESRNPTKMNWVMEIHIQEFQLLLILMIQG